MKRPHHIRNTILCICTKNYISKYMYIYFQVGYWICCCCCSSFPLLPWIVQKTIPGQPFEKTSRCVDFHFFIECYSRIWFSGVRPCISNTSNLSYAHSEILKNNVFSDHWLFGSFVCIGIPNVRTFLCIILFSRTFYALLLKPRFKGQMVVVT